MNSKDLTSITDKTRLPGGRIDQLAGKAANKIIKNITKEMIKEANKGNYKVTYDYMKDLRRVSRWDREVGELQMSDLRAALHTLLLVKGYSVEVPSQSFPHIIHVEWGPEAKEKAFNTLMKLPNPLDPWLQYNLPRLDMFHRIALEIQ